MVKIKLPSSDEDAWRFDAKQTVIGLGYYDTVLYER